MQYTSNLNLKKPDTTDYVNVSDLNDNMDIIDQTITEISDSSSGIEQQLNEHLDDTMPHRFVDNGKTYRWGFRTVNGEPQMIYEEVV